MTLMPDSMASQISSETFFNAYGGAKYNRYTRDEPTDSGRLRLVTFCVIVLKNGYTVVGESICLDEKYYDKETQEFRARAMALKKLQAVDDYIILSNAI